MTRARAEALARAVLAGRPHSHVETARALAEHVLECAYAHVLVERAALRAAGEIDADQFDDEMRALVARAMCEDPGERGLEILAALGVE